MAGDLGKRIVIASSTPRSRAASMMLAPRALAALQLLSLLLAMLWPHVARGATQTTYAGNSCSGSVSFTIQAFSKCDVRRSRSLRPWHRRATAAGGSTISSLQSPDVAFSCARTLTHLDSLFSGRLHTLARAFCILHANSLLTNKYDAVLVVFKHRVFRYPRLQRHCLYRRLQLRLENH